MALPQVKADATEARIAALTVPTGADWATKARKEALDRLTAMGVPARRDEYWRFTNPADVSAAQAPTAAVFSSEDVNGFANVDALRIVFVDGVFDESASDALAMDGIEIARLSDATAQDIHWAKELFGVLEANGQNPVDRPMSALNTAFANDGIVIHVTSSAPRPVSITYVQNSDTSDVNLRHVIKIEEGAEFTLLETGPAGARYNIVGEVDVADRASFHHVRTQGRDHERRAITGLFGRLGTESLFKSFTLTANGVMTRNEVVLELTGDDAKAHVAGAAIGDGSDFHHDDTVFVTHDAVDCESRQVFKKVLRNGAVGVFQGKILVKADAQKTDGYQISQGLLLDDDAQFLAKPELEIYADDVACSHGSTVGAIDDTAMFYLQSRGVPAKDAKNLLTLAFLAEAVEEIDDEGLAAEIQVHMAAWLERHI